MALQRMRGSVLRIEEIKVRRDGNFGGKIPDKGDHVKLEIKGVAPYFNDSVNWYGVVKDIKKFKKTKDIIITLRIDKERYEGKTEDDEAD